MAAHNPNQINTLNIQLTDANKIKFANLDIDKPKVISQSRSQKLTLIGPRNVVETFPNHKDCSEGPKNSPKGPKKVKRDPK